MVEEDDEPGGAEKVVGALVTLRVLAQPFKPPDGADAPLSCASEEPGLSTSRTTGACGMATASWKEGVGASCQRKAIPAKLSNQASVCGYRLDGRSPR